MCIINSIKLLTQLIANKFIISQQGNCAVKSKGSQFYRRKDVNHLFDSTTQTPGA